MDPTYLSNLGVIYQHVTSDDEVNALAKERNYKNRDEITVSPEKMGAIYEEKVKSFFHEHLHGRCVAQRCTRRERVLPVQLG